MSISDQSTSPSKAPAVEKAFAILEFVGQARRTNFATIYKSLALPKSSAHHLVETLVQIGMLRHSDDGHYLLGLRLFELGSLAVSNRNLRHDALPIMRELSAEIGLASHLGALEDREAVYLVKTEGGRHPVTVNSWEGKRVSLHSSALGKVLLAWKAEVECDAILAGIELVRKTDTTITDIACFKQHLAQVRRQGWAIDDGEDFADIRCLAVPVYDINGEVAYALSVSGTLSQLRRERIGELCTALARHAGRISRVLGFRPELSSREVAPPTHLAPQPADEA